VQLAKSSETVALSPAAKARFAQLAKGLKSQLDAADGMARTDGAYAE
jgi:hypothetical protein